MFNFIAGLALLAIPVSVSGEPPGMPLEGTYLPRTEELDTETITMAYALMWGQDVALVRDIVSCESGYDEKATTSLSSAKGLTQIIDGTWKHFNCQGDPLDAEDNLTCGMKILSTSGKQHWSECL